MDGLEVFTHGWKNNQNYKFTFADTDLDAGGFEWLVLGNLNPSNNTYTPAASFTLPAFGKKLVATVLTTIGASVSELTISAQYANTVSIKHGAQGTLFEGASVGTSAILYIATIDTGLISIFSVDTNQLASGSIQIAAPKYVFEPFINTDWDPPDPGL